MPHCAPPHIACGQRCCSGWAGSFEVRYDSGNPDRHLLPRIHEEIVPLFAVLFPFVFVGLGAILLRVGAREATGPLRLYRVGEATLGRVVGFEEVRNERINGRHPTRIRYSFRDAVGNERQGATKTLDRELIETLEEGTELTVLYDARDPERNVLFAALWPAGDRSSRL